MKVRFVFYRAKFEWRSFLKTRKIHLVDDVISWWTFLFNWKTGPYSHVEVWLPGKDGLFRNPTRAIRCLEAIDFYGTCWTSTMRGNEKGTCSRPASEVLKHPERWEYKEYDIDEYQFTRGKLWMQREVANNKGYGFKNFGTFFGLGKLIYEKWKNICSQFCNNYAVMIDLLPTPFKVVSPRRLSRKLPGKMRRLV